VQSGKTINIHRSPMSISWSSNSGVSRWAYLWTDEGIAMCIAIIKEKDRIYTEQLTASTTASKIKAEVTKILEPMWTQVRAKAKPALKQVLPFIKPVSSPPTRPVAKVSASRPCCVGCKKFQIHPNPPPHFTAEDMAHCCALCRLSNGKRHGDHCTKQKY
jgi:hypothetical protein